MEGDVPRVERDDYARGTVYGYTVPFVGGYEDVSEQYDWGPYKRVGERAIWQCGGSSGGGSHDAAGCAEDADDACEGADGIGAAAEADIEG